MSDLIKWVKICCFIQLSGELSSKKVLSLLAHKGSVLPLGEVG